MTPNLGRLKELYDKIEDTDTNPLAEGFANILIRMAEVDGNISKSLYADVPDTEDRPPTGDDYDLLWDAVINEMVSALQKVWEAMIQDLCARALRDLDQKNT